MRLDIDRGGTQQEVHRQQAGEQAAAAAPRHYHQDGGDAYVRTGESRRGTLTDLLRAFYQVVEEAVFVAGAGQQFLVVVEVVADGGEDAVCHVVGTDGGKVELGACHGHEDINKVVDEERSDDGKGNLLQQVVAVDEVPQHDDEHHGVVEEIAQIEGLAHPHLREAPAEPDGRLSAEKELLGGGEHVVQVGEEAVELEGVRIPVGEQRHLNDHPHEGRKFAGSQAVEVHQHEGDGGYERTVPQHLSGMVHPVIEEDNQHGCQQVIYQRYFLNRKQPFVGLYSLEYV